MKQQFKKTAIAMGVAQIAFMSSGAMAQTAPAAEPVKVIVSGQRAALQSAQKLKQNSDEIMDSIVADDIGKLPDGSVTEVLQRIVGVTIDRSMSGDPQHYAVEGSGVAIRGLNYVRSEMNGRDSFSANGGRGLNFEDVPPELMAGVDVYKNPSAEQIEGAVSGLVNLRTALPFDNAGFKGAITAKATYSSLLKEKATPSYSLLVSDRWKTSVGEFGLLVDFANSESNTRTDAIKVDAFYPRTNLDPSRLLWVPKGVMWRTMDFQRERQGQYAAAQYRTPSKDLTATLTYFKSKYHMTWSEQALLMQHTTPYQIAVGNGVYDDNGNFVSGTLTDTRAGGINMNADRRVADRDSSTTDIALKLDWKVAPQWRISTDIQSIKADTKGFDSDVATGLRMPAQTLDLSGELPKITFNNADLTRLGSPNSYYWAYTMEHLDRATADSKAVKVDVQYDFDHPVLRDIRFGVRSTDRSSHTQNTNPSYNWQGITQPWMTPWRIKDVAYLGDPRFNNETRVHQFDNFFGGKADVPAVVFPNDSLARGYPETYRALHEYQQVLCRENNQTCSPWSQATFGNDPREVAHVDEKTKAFFTQLRFGFDDLKYPIDGNVGVRYVKTDSRSLGSLGYRRPQGPSADNGNRLIGGLENIAPFIEKMDFSNSYSNILPSLNLKMKVSEKLQFRLAMGKAMSRPDFSSLQGNTNLAQNWYVKNDTVAKTSTVFVNFGGEAAGNPMLKPTTATQIDLTAEWYFAPSSSLTFSLFNKDLKDVVITQIKNISHTDGGVARNFMVSEPRNGADGNARGFELAYQQYYDFLPDWAKGLGSQASLTFVDSKRTLHNPITSAYCTGLGQGGDSAGNLNLYTNGCDTDGRTFNDLPLVGLSRRTINLSLMYDKGPVSARLAYNWRSRNLQAVNTWGTRGTDGTDTNPASATRGSERLSWGLPLWAAAYGQLDGSFSYKFTEKLGITLEAQNLNDAVFKQEMEQHSKTHGHSWFVTGPRYSASMHYKF